MEKKIRTAQDCIYVGSIIQGQGSSKSETERWIGLIEEKRVTDLFGIIFWSRNSLITLQY